MLRRVASLSALLFGAVLVAGCPTPPEQSTTPGGQAPPPQGQQGPTAGGGGGPTPGGNAGGPTPGGNAGGGNAGGAPPDGGGGLITPPSFKDIISGDTITITVNVKGGTKGQIDFMTIGEGPTALHVEPFEGQGPFKVTAPANYDQEVFIAAMNFANGATISPDDPVGTTTKALKLGAKDIKVDVEIGKTADWFVPPGDAPPPPGAGTPPQGGGGAGGDAPAGGPPPGGDAGGPPPGGDGGAPPPGGDAGGPPPGGDAGAPPPGGDAGAPPTP